MAKEQEFTQFVRLNCWNFQKEKKIMCFNGLMKPAALDPYLLLAAVASSDFSFLTTFLAALQSHGLLLACRAPLHHLLHLGGRLSRSHSGPVDCTAFTCARVDNDGPEIYFQIILITIIRFGSSVWVKRDSSKSFPAVTFFLLL